jgi:hypothetical protein
MGRYFEGNPFESQPEHGHSYRDVTWICLTSDEYGYGTFINVMTTSSHIITYCLLIINTPLPLVPCTANVDLELPGDRLRSCAVLFGLHETSYGLFTRKCQVDHSATYSINSIIKQPCVLCGMTNEVLAFEYIRFCN